MNRTEVMGALIELPREERIFIHDSMVRHGKEELCPVCEDLVCHIQERLRMYIADMEKLIEASMERSLNEMVVTEVEGRLDQVSGNWKSMVELTKKFGNFISLKEHLDRQQKEVLEKSEKMKLVIEKLSGIITELAEYIDIKKNINLRKDTGEKPRAMSKKLRNITNKIKEVDNEYEKK